MIQLNYLFAKSDRKIPGFLAGKIERGVGEFTIKTEDGSIAIDPIKINCTDTACWCNVMVGATSEILNYFDLPDQIADVAGSCFLGRFRGKQSEMLLDVSRFSKSFQTTRVLWELDWSAILGWETELEYKILVIGAQIGWEWHKFYSENQLRHDRLGLPHGDKDLILSGFFASVVIGF